MVGTAPDNVTRSSRIIVVSGSACMKRPGINRLAPLKNAAKPPGEWQTLDVVFVDRHVTVTLNGRKIIDNQPVLGPTGGALWPEVDKPGPIYLQGDHTGIEYRNLSKSLGHEPVRTAPP